MPSSEGTNNTRSTPTHPRPLTPGVYVPTPAFFHTDAAESLDLPTLAQHAVRLARAGVTGLAVQGSNGEAVHLTDAERGAVIRATRSALDDAGFAAVPLVVGCGAQSTRQTVAMCRQAAECGGDAVLVLPPSYYQGLFRRGSAAAGEETVVGFFREVAEASPLPVVVYNYPGATAGLDLSSDVLVQLGRAHANIVGAKFTCGNTGKLGRVVASVFPKGGVKKPGREGVSHSHHASGPTPDFLCFAGSGDFMVPALSAGAAGVIGGIANVAPKACVRLYEAFRDGRLDEAEALQQVIARGDWAAIQSGIIGVKTCLQEYEGYGGWARKPLPRPEGDDERKKIVDGFRELMELEKAL
ncbi:unnamed protein product [Discula destructiva]